MILEALGKILEELQHRFEKIAHQYQPSKRFIKVKFGDFTQTTLDEAIIDRTQAWLSPNDYQRLMLAGWQRKKMPVRLLGAGLRLEPRKREDADQLALFDSE